MTYYTKMNADLVIILSRDLPLITELSAAKLKQQPSIQLDTQKIQDMVLFSPNKLLLSIPDDKKVVLVDIETLHVLSEIVLQDNPRYICMTSAHLAASTLVNKHIQFIKVNRTTLEADTTVNVDVDVMGIAGYRNNLVVSYDPPGVKIIAKDGALIYKLDNTTAGREVFKYPRRIVTTSDDSIYVTDWGTNEITRLDFSLTILQTFSSSLLKVPLGIISLNRDQLLICSNDNNNILLIRPSTNSMTVLLDKQHGVEKPRYICFCKEQQKLYVAPAGKMILVYQLS